MDAQLLKINCQTLNFKKITNLVMSQNSGTALHCGVQVLNWAHLLILTTVNYKLNSVSAISVIGELDGYSTASERFCQFSSLHPGR